MAQEPERRKQRRNPLQVPLVCRGDGNPIVPEWRGRTVDISSRGCRFVVNSPTGGEGPLLGDRINVAITIPRGSGHYPYDTRIHTRGRVVRRDQIDGKSQARVGAVESGKLTSKLAISVEFDDVLNLALQGGI